MVAYRHGLRAVEAADLEWSQIEFGRYASLHVRRAKKGKPAVHPIRGDELRMLTALRKEYPDSCYVFSTERGTPFTTDAINRLVKTIGQRASLSLPVHFHMLRHSCGHKLAIDGIDLQARTPPDAEQWFPPVRGRNGAAAIVGQETVQYVGNIYKYYVVYSTLLPKEAS